MLFEALLSTDATTKVRLRPSFVGDPIMKADAQRREVEPLLKKVQLQNGLKSDDCIDINEEWKRVRLNVSGTIFETYRKTLIRKEGSIFKLENIRNYYDPLKKEYYFDRNPKAFEAIFVFMQCGILCQPPKVPCKVFIEELQFFGFGEKALKIYNDSHSKVTKKSTNIPYTDQNCILGTMWQIMEYPESSNWSKAVTSFSMCVILLAICLFSIETLPEVHGTNAIVYIKNMEYFCVTWFTLEITLRFVSSPLKSRFLMNIMNVIDIVSVIPYYVEILLQSKSYSKAVASSMRTLRVARIFNLMKLYRYSRAIRVMAKTLSSSIAELSMLFVFVAIGTMLFSPLLYYFEFNDDPDNNFQSIPQVFWFCVVTTTTVGFGDVFPVTAGGRLATSFLAIVSIILISLPIPIIGRNFDIYNKPDSNPEGEFVFDPAKSKQVEKESVVIDRETLL